MLKRFQFITENNLCSKEQRILATVSGGIDSMVMLDLFVRSGYNVAVAHANFMLRGEESDRDMEFVEKKCLHLGIPFFSKRMETNNYAMVERLSTQMAARELRYAWFKELIAGGKADLVATAHHLNDSIETILLHLVRGSGTDGLMGIPLTNGKIIRPMIFATRREIEEYAAEQGITWREDVSNLGDEYRRNFVRHRIIPLLRELNPSIEDALSRTILRVNGERELMESALSTWKSKFRTEGGGKVLLAKDGLHLLRYPQAVLLHLLEPFGFNFSTCLEIADHLDAQPGKRFLSPTHQLVMDRMELVLSPHHQKWNEVLIQTGENRSSIGTLDLVISETDKVEYKPDPEYSYLDLDKITFPLTWRTWRDGDFFYPLGMRQRKKVSDFLIDLKLSVTDKGTITVLESGNEIICLPGLRIDDRYKITAETSRVLLVKLGSSAYFS